MCRRLICLFLILAFGVVTSARAALIAYEGFDGTAGADVDGSSGGSGWAAGSVWTDDMASANEFVFTEPGMTFASLDTAGLKAVFIANGAYTGKYTRPLPSSITVDASNPEVWVSALVEIGTGSGDVNAGRGIGVELFNGDTKILGIGKGINKHFGVGPTLTGGASFIDVAGTRTVGVKFLALKLAWQGIDTQATAYVATGEEEGFDLSNVNTFTGSATITLTGPVTFDVVALYGSHGSTMSNGVDEIRIGNSYSDVLASPKADLAGNPSPANEEADVPREVVLSWSPGESADQHDVYFGTSYDAVNAATNLDPMGPDKVYRARQGVDSYAVDETLDFGQTYYWRIDEVNAAPDYTVFKGDVWSFTVEPFAYPIENITVTASSTNRASEGPENTINGSGLDDDDLHSVESTDMWLSSLTGDQPSWIEYEFDRVYKLHEMWVWNYNSSVEPAVGFGVKEATIEYSVDGTSWAVLGTTHEFARGPGEVSYAPNTTVDLGGLAAKYIRITANSNWGGMLRQYGLSEVRFLYIPVWATEPSPDSGATDVGVDAILSFRAGREAAKHDVYLSTDEQAVINGNVPVTTVTEPSYASSLDLAGTYYWRIDEMNDAEIPTTWQGDIWNLSTQEYLVVDDFESYNDIPAGQEGSNLIYSTWADGFENPANGSTIGYNKPFQPTIETSLVYDGQQSVPLFYDNTAATYSEVTANVADLDVGRDWTKHGIKALTLRFSGDPNNILQQMYVKINGSRVTYDGSAEDTRLTGWQMWYIDLASIGVNLGNVTELSIGFERIGAVGGKGMVLLDGIRLYSYDRQLIKPADPGTTGLQAYYEFEGNTNDSSGNARNGTAMGNPVFVAGKVGQAINLRGLNDYVEITGYKGILGSSAVTVTAWVKTISTDTGAIVGWGPNVAGQRFGFRLDLGRLRIEHHGGGVQGDTLVNDGSWHHVAVTIQENATISYPEVILYLDGTDDTMPTTDPDAFNLTAGEDVSIGRRPASNDRFFLGQIDDVRIYERALSPEEIAGSAGRTQPFDKPF